MKTNFPDLGLAILRIAISVMFLTHGIPKINMLFADTISFPDPLGVGATTSLILVLIGEVLAPIFVIIGYKTKLACIPPIITMLVAFFFIHFDDPFGKQEKALLFLLVFFVIFITGPGKFSIDKNN